MGHARDRDRLRNFVEGIAAMTMAAERGLTEADVRTPDHRAYLFRFHERVIAEARMALEAEHVIADRSPS